MNGVILLNKPAGMTSFDAVRQCKKVFHEKKIGHTGTLDPQASGLLIILMGRYTKLIPYCVKDRKHYIASFELGSLTDTEDIWGTVTDRKEYRAHTAEELEKTALRFLGESEQIPPMYSALKKDGKKLYEFAREGKVLDRPARRIHVDQLTVQKTGPNTFRMDAVVSSGTYIRSLIRDYCAALGEYGVMSALERVSIEHVSLSEACAFGELREDMEMKNPLEVISKEYAVLESTEEKRIRNGMDMFAETPSDQIIYISQNREILAAYRRIEKNRFHCERGLY